MTPGITRPAGVAFRPVVTDDPVTVNLPAVRQTPALDLLKAPDPRTASLEIDCRTAIGPALAAEARALVYAPSSSLYDQLLESPVAVRQLGVDTLERTNRVINELFEKENFGSLEEAANLLRDLRKGMRKLTSKYNPGDPKVLQFYRDWKPSLLERFKGIKSVGQLIMIDIQPLEAQMSAIEREARRRLEGLDDTLAYYDQMLELSESEVQNLMYVIAVMEFVLERAIAELNDMPERDPSDPFNNQRDKLGRFVRDMGTKINDFKAKLWLDAANGPRIMEMGNVTQSVALRMVAVINLVIPSMKQAIIDWNKTAQTVEAVRFIGEVNDTFNEVVQAGAKATSAAVPIMLRATETPMLSVETVYALGAMYDDIVAAVDAELKLGTEMKQQLREAQAEVLGRIISDKAEITEAYVRQALEAGNVSSPLTLVKPQDLQLDVMPSIESDK